MRNLGRGLQLNIRTMLKDHPIRKCKNTIAQRENRNAEQRPLHQCKYVIERAAMNDDSHVM